MIKTKEFFQNLVESGVISQEPINYDAATLKMYITYLEAENAALRERLKKAVELENKINNGELVDAIWFKSWINGQICCGSVIGYSDGCFVIACGDDLISANKIYTSREQARYGLDKKINKKEE